MSCFQCYQSPCCCISPCKTLHCNITIKDYTPCPQKCYQVWVPQSINIFKNTFIPGHYEYICSEEDSKKVDPQPCDQPHPQPQPQPHPHPHPHPQPCDQPLIGGCAGTRYGCCPSDGKTSKVDDQGSNCPPPLLIGGCAGTRYGCCKDGKTSKQDNMGSNCRENVPGSKCCEIVPCLYTCPTKCHDECIHYKVRQLHIYR